MDGCKVYIMRLQYMSFINYSYLVVDKNTNNAVLIDPAWDISKIKILLDEIQCKLDGILLTHSHYDHSNLADILSRKYGVNVYMSKIEKEKSQFSCVRLLPINDKDIINVGDTKIICLLTPGHTEGSVCYYVDGNLFSGDTIFIEGCGMCLSRESAKEMFYSVQRIKNSISTKDKIYPGHRYGENPGIEFEHLLKNNIYFQIPDIEDFVNFRMRQNQNRLFSFT